MHHQWLPDSVTIEKGRASDDVVEQLKKMGHTVTVGGQQGDANSILVDDKGQAWGANDRRTVDGKASVPARLTSAR
jgi:gamma-glutamyltranspeptidase/glutathione hydrolase